MLVCHCRGLTERDIRRAARDGAATHAQVARECGAGAGCGGCHPVIAEILESERAPSADYAVLELAPAR